MIGKLVKGLTFAWRRLKAAVVLPWFRRTGRPLPDVTTPFWNWLLDQNPRDVQGERFVAQQKDPRWLQQAS